MPVDLLPSPALSDASVSVPAPMAGPADPDFENRWAAWKARGRVHEAMVRRKLIRVGVALAIVAAAIAAGVRLFGVAL
jgi:hypothetical protein